MMTGISWSPGASRGTGGSTERTTNVLAVSAAGPMRIEGGVVVGVVGREILAMVARPAGEASRAHAVERSSRDADAPREFERRLHFWRDECGLPSEAHSQLQTLRIWRNASLHHDADQWRQKGPSSAQAASEHLAALSSAVDRLCSRQGAVR